MSFAPEHPGARVRPSPNFGPRLGVAGPDMIILHYTGMGSAAGAESWLCNPESGVSSHYLVHEDGAVVQFVRERDRAWHAGVSSWKGDTDINSRSVGVEIVNGGHAFGSPDFPARQIDAVISLCRDVSTRHAVAAERVLGHSDVAPGRKTDPGEKFPWAALHAAGVGHYVAPAPLRRSAAMSLGSQGKAVLDLQTMLARYGYGVEATGEFDEQTAKVVTAFQQHFRQRRADGVADRSTVRTLHALIAALKGA